MRFPISYWYGPPLAAMTAERYAEVAACGFTVAAPPHGSSVAVNLRHLDLCHAAGITGFVGDQRLLRERDAVPLDQRRGWEQEVVQAVRDYAGHPALYGYYIGDEPHRKDFDDQARLCRLLHRLDPNHVAYINLYPNYAAPHLPGSALDQLGTPTYEDHVAEFMRLVQPRVLCYDHYALFDDGTLRPEYFANLEVIRSNALEHRRPFWQIILVTPHFRYRDPNEAELRWQAYTTLAYGGQGLSYFTYWSPTHANFRDALVDPFGDRTPHYAWVRRVNGEVQALGPTLLSLRSLRVFRTETDAPAPHALVRGVAGGSFVVGEFSGRDGSSYILIVNNDLAHAARAHVELTEQADVLEVDRVGGGLAPLQEEGTPEDRRVGIRLAPGDGRLFHLAAR